MDDILEKITNKLLTAFNDLLKEDETEKPKKIEHPVLLTNRKVFKTLYVLTDRSQKNTFIRLVPLPSSQFITDGIGKVIRYRELVNELCYLNNIRSGYSISAQFMNGQRMTVDSESDYGQALETALSLNSYLDLCLYFVVPPLDPKWMDELPAEVRLVVSFPESILSSIEKKLNETKKEVEKSVINKIVTSMNKTLANIDKEQKKPLEIPCRESSQCLYSYTCVNCQNSAINQYANGSESSKGEQAKITKVEEDKNLQDATLGIAPFRSEMPNLVKKNTERNSEEIENLNQLVDEFKGKKKKENVCLDASLLPGISSKLTFEAGSRFTKIWNVRNVGSTSWDSSTLLKFVSGDLNLETEGKIREFSVPHLKPNESGVISINFIVPNTCGNYSSFWRLYHKGKPFGGLLFCDIKVVDVKTSVDELACHLKADEDSQNSKPKPTLQAALQALHDSNNFVKKDVKSHTVTPNSTPFTFSPPKSPEPNDKNEKCDETSDEDSGSSIVQLDRVNSDSSLSESMDFVFVSKCFGLSSPLSSQIIEPLDMWKDPKGNNEVTTQPKSHITSRSNATEKVSAETSVEPNTNNCESLVEISDKPDVSCGFEILVPPPLSATDSIMQKTSCDIKAESLQNTGEKNSINEHKKIEINAIGNVDLPDSEDHPELTGNQKDAENTKENEKHEYSYKKQTEDLKTDNPSKIPMSTTSPGVQNFTAPIMMRSSSNEFKAKTDASNSNDNLNDSKTQEWNKPSDQDQDQSKDFQNVDFNTPVINLVDAVKSVSQHAISICRGVGLLALKQSESTIGGAVGGVLREVSKEVCREISKNQQKMEDNTSTNSSGVSNKADLYDRIKKINGNKLKLVENSRSENITVMDESMIQLFEMGFTDYSLNQKLLLKNDYIMSDTIDELLRLKDVVSTQPRNQNQRKYDFLKELD